MRIRALALLALAMAPLPLRAQLADVAMKVQPEVRVDALFRDSRTTVEAGGGVQIPMGYYVRVGVIGAVGTTFVSGASETTGRLDILGRFLFDPFRQNTYGISAGAGLSVRAEPGEKVRPLLLAALDVEGKRTFNGASPALQIGLGGGVRVGLGLRWGAARFR